MIIFMRQTSDSGFYHWFLFATMPLSCKEIWCLEEAKKKKKKKIQLVFSVVTFCKSLFFKKVH